VPDELVSRIIALSLQFVPANSSTLFLADNSKRELYCVASRADALVQFFHMPFDAGVPGLAATTRVPVRAANPAVTYPVVTAMIEKLTGESNGPAIGVPLLNSSSHQLIGVLLMVGGDHSLLHSLA
jgi:hypothetical protein